MQVGSAPHGTCIVRLKVEGMTCGSCSAAVTNMLMATPGVTHAAVSHATHSAEVHFDRGQLSKAAVAEVIDDCGFDAEVLEEARAHFVRVAVPEIGLDPDKLRHVLAPEPGIVGAPRVDAATDTATVYYDAGRTGPRHILAALERAGYAPALADAADAAAAALGGNAAKARDAWQALLAALAFSIPVVLIAKAPLLSPALARALRAPLLGFPFDELAKWVLTTPVQFVVGGRFHRGALASLRRGAANMDVLVSLGTTASYGYSVLSILHHHFMEHHATSAPLPLHFPLQTSTLCLAVYAPYSSASA